MTSLSSQSYAARLQKHSHPVARKLFEIAEAKKTNLVLSADLTDTKSLLEIADKLGPHIAVLKTHVDLVHDFGAETIQGLIALKEKHNFVIFEDRKLVDIGHTVQLQYHGGVLKLSEFAEIVNLSVLGGDGIVEALAQTIAAPDFPYPKERGFLILAEMTSKGSLAVGSYTEKCIELARKHTDAVMGFVSTRALTGVLPGDAKAGEDFVTFTTGVNMASKGDKLGQQYQTPADAVRGGADFLIAGRGIYAADDPVGAARQYQKAGWEAYLARVSGSV